MTHLFTLVFLACMQTADARPHHRHARHTRPPAHHHVRKPVKIKTYKHNGHKYYTHDGITWIWRGGHWATGLYVRGHWEISVHL
jgi:hypothetical protein